MNQVTATTKKRGGERNKSHRLIKAHDRRSRDLPLNAEVAAIEVDDLLALEPGEKIVTLRSIRNDPLGRLHSHRQIDEAQYQGGRAFQNDWEKAEHGPQAVDPTREYVDGVQKRSRSPRASARPCCGWAAPSANSAPTARRSCMRC